MTPTSVPANPFAPAAHERRKVRIVTRNKWIMFGFCVMLVLPLLLILVDMVWKPGA